MIKPLFRALGGTALRQPLAGFARLRMATAALALVLSFVSVPVLAEDITWPGNGQLRTSPIPVLTQYNALYPDAFSGNSVTVNGDVGVVGQDFGNNRVYGGISVGADAVANNRVTINGGTVYDIVYGGYSNGSGNVTGNSVIVNGGTVDNKVYGGFSYNTVDLR